MDGEVVRLKLNNPRFGIDADGYPFIAVEVEGREARISIEQKLFRYGFLFLGSDFEETVPVLYAPAQPELGRREPAPLHGFSNDPRLLALYERLRQEDRQGALKARRVNLPEV